MGCSGSSAAPPPPESDPEDKVIKVVSMDVNPNARADRIAFLTAVKRINLPVGVDLPVELPVEHDPDPIVVEFQIKTLQFRLTSHWDGMPPEQLAKATSIWCFVSLASMLEAEKSTLKAFSKIVNADHTAMIVLLVVATDEAQQSEHGAAGARAPARMQHGTVGFFVP